MTKPDIQTLHESLREICLNPEESSAVLLVRVIDFIETNPVLLSIEEADPTLRILKRTRPSMAAFSELALRIENQWRSQPLLDPLDVMKEMRNMIAEADRLLARRVRKQFAALPKPLRLLMLGYSRSVINSLQACAELIESVQVLESLPGAEGRDMAAEFASFIQSVEVIPDSELADAAKTATAGCIGADTVFADGVVVNKVLSRRLAEEIHALEKPFYVIANRWKMAGIRSTELGEEEPERFVRVPAALVTRILCND